MRLSFLKFIEKYLRSLAIKVLKKHNPEIIAITGSNGKSSTKEAIALVLKSKFSVLASSGNYNTEFGVPLVILEQKAPSNIILWPITLIKCFFYAHFHNRYYEKLVLELAADKPGDIKYLTSFIKPKVAILTNIGPSHLKEFKTISNVASEKKILLEQTKSSGTLCLNMDDERIHQIGPHFQQKIIWYGINPQADIWASDINQNFSGLNFHINYKNDSLPITLKNTLGQHFIYPVLAAIACGLIYDIGIGKTIHELRELRLPPGRMKIIKGINDSIIIDDSYNANPQSMIAAISTVQELCKTGEIHGRRIGVLGSMNELGDSEKKGHEEVGNKIIGSFDYLLTIGKSSSQYLASKAIEKGFPVNRIHKFDNSLVAGKFLKKFIKRKDIILVKGSQNNVRTEWVVEQIMAEPEKSGQLLVRQYKPWEKPKELKEKP